MVDLKDAQKDGIVIGLKNISGVLERREIDKVLLKEPDVFNLYLLALERLQEDKEGKQDKMGYFQVAGR